MIWLDIGIVAAVILGVLFGLGLIIIFDRDFRAAVYGWILERSERPPRARRLDATALNGRQLGGVRCHGDLGPPSNVLLAG